MQLTIDKFVPAKVTHVNKRTENHGNKLIHAIDLNWQIDCPNSSLDVMFGAAGKSLRLGAYEAVETDMLPGVEASTPRLRPIFALVKGPHSLKFEGTGYMLTIKTGEVSNETIELAGSETSKAKIDFKDGGSVTVMFSSSHTGLNKKSLGELTALDGREVSLLSAPPLMQEGTTPDKKNKDDKTLPLPLNAPRQPKPKEAGEQFAENEAAGANREMTPEEKRKAEKAARFPTEAAKAEARKRPAAKKPGVPTKVKMAMAARKAASKTAKK